MQKQTMKYRYKRKK